MARKVSILIFIILFFGCIVSAEIVSPSGVNNQKEGYALLENLILTFKALADEKASNISKVDEALSSAMADAIKANSESKVDPVFFRRYSRVLMIIKLIVVEDRTGILGSLVGQELGNFVEDVKGVKGELTGGKGIANVADAITEEIINLHLYLDNKEKKKKLREEIEQKFGSRR